MRMRSRSILLLPLLLATAAALGQVSPRMVYTPDPAPRPVVLIDYYHHSEPSLAVGDLIVTGGYADNRGRYAVNDFHHTNSFDPLVATLERDYALVLNRTPLTAEHLEGADIVVIFTPDAQALNPQTPQLSAREIDDLEAFVQAGGSLLLMVNAWHPTELMDQEGMRRLFQRFGLDWNDDDTGYVDLPVDPEHPWFYDMPMIHYGAGCTLRIAPQTEAQVMLDVVGDDHHPDVRGPGIVLVRHGAGKVIAMGDTGSWTGNMSRPWTDNPRFLRQLFACLKSDQPISQPRYEPGQRLTYTLTLAQTRVIPVRNTLNVMEPAGFRAFEPRPRTRIWFQELYGDVEVIASQAKPSGVTQFDVTLNNLRCFDEPAEFADPAGPDRIRVTTSRMGAIASLEPDGSQSGTVMHLLSPLFAFIPNEALRPGDRWNKKLTLPVPTIHERTPAPLREIDLELTYNRDEVVQDTDCLVVTASAHVALEDLGVTVKDLLPRALIKGANAHRYTFRHPRGGTLLLKQEQWIERSTGIVVEARLQLRYLAWIVDAQEPAGPLIADIDNQNLVVAALDLRFRR